MVSKTASVEHTRKEKRDAEGDGRDLLVAYLSDVGGYDRNYRDVEGQDESGSSGNIMEITYNCHCACGLHMKTLSDSHPLFDYRRRLSVGHPLIDLFQLC